MPIMKKGDTEALQWFVDFANLDLEHIGPGDKAKLLVEAEEHLWPKKELTEYQSLMPPGYPLPAKIVGELERMVKVPSRESAEYWSAVLRSQAVVRKTFVQYIVPTVHPSRENIKAKGKPAVGHVVRGQDEVLWWVVKGYKVPYTVKLLPVAKCQDDYLPLKIFMLLDGLPQHAIRRCPGCKRFFVNPTNREKRFCSERCMRRICTAEYREKHKQAYNGYQKDLMKDRYREECNKRRQVGSDSRRKSKGGSHANL
jgi:hypothetical protein